MRPLRLFPKTSRTNVLIAACAALVVIIGGAVLYRTMASGFFAVAEVDDATLSANAKLITDGSAAGGKAVQFTAPAPAPAPTPPPPTPTPPPPSGGGCVTNVTGSMPACQMLPPAPLGAGKHWDVGFTEEFNTTDYDHNKLTPCFDWNYGDCTSSFNAGYEHYLASQISVSGGLAHLLAAPLSPAYSSSACYNSSCTYKSGLLSTARKTGNDPASAYLYKFTYGYVEANLKVVNQQGFFVAWWLLPADTSYSYHYDANGTPNASGGAFRYEIDILEMLGHDPTDMEMHYSWADGGSAYYSPNDSSKNGACPDNTDFSQGFHRFGMDWEPTFVAFYIDGVKCGQHNATGSAPVPNIPMQLIMNQMVSVNWQRSVGKPLLNTSLSSDLQVDYMRVYQQL